MEGGGKIEEQDRVVDPRFSGARAGLPCNPDHLHFTAEGYRQFGKRYAEKMLSLLGYKVNSESKLGETR